MDLLPIYLLSRVQYLPATYKTNNITNNIAELLARIMADKLVSLDTVSIILYDSTVVHSQNFTLLGTIYIGRQRERKVFPAINRMYTRRLNVLVQPRPAIRHINTTHSSVSTMELQHSVKTLSLRYAILLLCGKTWTPDKHIDIINTTVYIKIKSYQLRSNGCSKYHTRPQLFMVLVYSNHWTNKTWELQYTNQTSRPFPLKCNTTRTLVSLYVNSMDMYYGVYPVETDISDFTTVVYQVEIILQLINKPEVRWYTRNLTKL